MAEAGNDDPVYVAVGKDVEESRLTLLWALRNLGVKKLDLLHVYQPIEMTPSSSGLEESEINKILQLEWESLYESLNKYRVICRYEGVNEQDIDTSCISMRDVGEGIVALIYDKEIKKLVMGGAADNKYHEGMVHVASRKAKYVSEHVPHHCRIWFVCNGNLIQTGEGQFDRDDSSVSSLEFSDSASLSSQTDLTSALVPYEGTRRAEHEIESHAMPSSGDRSEESSSDQIYRQLRHAISEAKHKAVEAIQSAREFETKFNLELRLRKETEETLNKERENHEETKRERDEALSNARNAQRLYNDELGLREEAEEELEKVKKEMETIKKEMEEALLNHMDCPHLLEMYQKERDDAIKTTEELLRGLSSEETTSSQSPSSLLPNPGSDQPPPYFICPISKEIMRNPHVAADGYTYEADEFREWLRNGDNSPLTNLRLEHHNLIPNHPLRSAIEEWLQQHPHFLDSA